MSIIVRMMTALAALRDGAGSVKLSYPPEEDDLPENGPIMFANTHRRLQRYLSTTFQERSKEAQIALTREVEAFVEGCRETPTLWGTLERLQTAVLASWAKLNGTAYCSASFFEWEPGGPEYLEKLADVGDLVLELLEVKNEDEHAADIPEPIREQLRSFLMSPYGRPKRREEAVA